MNSNETIEIMKDKLLNAAGKYADYQRYRQDLANLDEQYDETLEVYNFDIWWGNSNGTIRDKAAHMLRVTMNLFEDMADNAERELLSVLEEITAYSREEQKQIWEKDLFLDREAFSHENLEEALLDWDTFPYAQEEALAQLKEVVESAIQVK